MHVAHPFQDRRDAELLQDPCYPCSCSQSWPRPLNCPGTTQGVLHSSLHSAYILPKRKAGKQMDAKTDFWHVVLWCSNFYLALKVVKAGQQHNPHKTKHWPHLAMRKLSCILWVIAPLLKTAVAYQCSFISPVMNSSDSLFYVIVCQYPLCTLRSQTIAFIKS